MKKIFFYVLLSSLFFIQGCSSDYDLWETETIQKTNFPKQSEELGKAVAQELREMVKNLNAMGVDYSNMDNSAEFKAQFFENLDMATPALTRNGKSINQIQITPEVFTERFNNLTNIQIEFIERLTKETNESTSFVDLAARLMSINKDIYSNVPKIEQERLFNVTAVFYYVLEKIDKLEQQGQMLITPHNLLQTPRVKSGSESGGGWAASCKRFLEAGWAIAIGEPTITGEIVMAVATVIVAGILLYEVVTCPPENHTVDDCAESYVYCVEYTWWYDCSTCLHQCRSSGHWRCPTY